MKASVLIAYLKKYGWQEIRQQGIHRILTHPNHPTLISVPDLGEEFLQPDIINNIAREAGLKGRVNKIQWSPSGIVTILKNIFGFTR